MVDDAQLGLVRVIRTLLMLMAITAIPGCSTDSSSLTGHSSRRSETIEKVTTDDIRTVANTKVAFKDAVQSNVEVPAGLDGVAFLDTDGQRVSLKDFLGRKNVVLVFTEGFSKMLCPFCKTQTSRLVANYSKFEELDAEVLVVYPGTRDHLDKFMEAAKTTEKVQVDSLPFPILLDEDLGATRFFNINSNLAHPSTFIIDKSGNIRLAYVGADMSADRPSIKAMLGALHGANGSD